VKKRSEWINLVVLVLIGFGIGMYVGKCIYQPGPINLAPQKIPEKLVRQENKKISKLKIQEKQVGDTITIIKEKINKVWSVRVKELNKIDSLPLDSNINYLRQKIREYEK
jgi:hypothetical protein